MKWTCTACSLSAIANPVSLLVRQGWWITELGGGLCPECARKASEKRNDEVVKRARSTHRSAVETRRMACRMFKDPPAQRRNLRP
jgi:hypothetical protein